MVGIMSMMHFVDDDYDYDCVYDSQNAITKNDINVDGHDHNPQEPSQTLSYNNDMPISFQTQRAFSLKPSQTKILHQFIGRLSHYLPRFIHPWWWSPDFQPSTVLQALCCPNRGEILNGYPPEPLKHLRKKWCLP